MSLTVKTLLGVASIRVDEVNNCAIIFYHPNYIISEKLQAKFSLKTILQIKIWLMLKEYFDNQCLGDYTINRVTFIDCLLIRGYNKFHEKLKDLYP